MKVVLFCGGLGMRLREYSEQIPKPMVHIGYRPILWHVMKYYAHFGYKDFILCLGYKADVIKRYFYDYSEFLSNDFVLSDGGANVELLNRDIQDWTITFVDTGTNSSIGQRLKAVERFLTNEEVFFANYSDGLTDLDLPRMLASYREQDKIASMVCVRPRQTFHIVETEAKDGVDIVTGVQDSRKAGPWMNGGYFIFRPEIFRYIHEREDLVEQPFQRLIHDRQLTAYKYDGFWACMDTFKDKQELEEMYANGVAPWEVWRPPVPVLQTNGKTIASRV